MNGVLKVNKRTLALFVLPCLLFYLSFVFVPIVVSIYYSFMEWAGMGERDFVGLDNYVNLFTRDPIFWPSVLRTLYIALFSLAQIPIAIFVAILLSRYVKRPNLLISSYFLPVILSVVVIGQLWMAVYNPVSLGGMLNGLLDSIGLESWTKIWLADPVYAIFALCFVIFWQYIGYHVLIQFTGVQNISNDLYEAASIDGADGFKADRYITLPLLAPVVKISVVLAVIGSLKAFDLIVVMTGGGPANSTEVISTHMYYMTFKSFKYGYGSTISTVLVIFCLVMTVLLNLAFKRAEENSS
ncbi:carbohydrate ABC transporter permease [Paenibacillus sp. L3-i20]|uniref:carbohydrate ABC transporter permease n=1 Tax=Paenibacillus sp. L3-i20 TaxID=2905833 RepID=UPI001EDFD6E1|nr:sugar ABC transporter permease [Paenibacillus sp. L3-i20]GKU80603.1 sugar ABC transporter permease [Paenibacillus sp. L3-i20]